MARAAAALLPESFSVFRPIDKACFNRSASIGAEGTDGVDADEVRGELFEAFASVMIKIPKKAKIMVMEQTSLHSGNVLK